jgi:hypothetical protein
VVDGGDVVVSAAMHGSMQPVIGAF